MHGEWWHDVDKVNSSTMNKPHRFILNGGNTKMCLVPFCHWDIEHRQIEPTTTHPSHWRNINLVGQTISIDQRDLQSYDNHANKNHNRIQRRFKSFIMNNLNINPQFIGSQQTHRTIGLHRIDQSEDAMIIVFKIIRERDFHLGTSYGPVGLWWTTHTSSWGQQGWWRGPPWSIPLRQVAGTELQMTSWQNRDLRRHKKGFGTASRVFGILLNL